MHKRVISFLCALVMLLTMAPWVTRAEAVEAAVTPVVSVENTWVTIGKTVEVDLRVSNNPGIIGGIFTVSWAEGLELVSAKSKEAFEELNYQKPSNYNRNGTNFMWYGDSVSEALDGVFLTLTFAVAEGVATDQILAIHVTAKDVLDSNKKALTVQCIDGGVQVIDYMPGDVTDDGVIDMFDITDLAQYISDNCVTDPNGFNVSVNDKAANVDDNGVIDMMDLILICQYVSDDCETRVDGFNVTLLPVSPKCDHKMEEIPYKAPTCTEEGNPRYYYCTNCEKYFNDVNGSVELPERPILPATDHTYAEEWSYDQNYHWHAATCEHTDLVKDREEHSIGADKLCKVCGMSNSPDPTKPYMITYKLVEYNKQNGDTYLETLHIDNSKNKTWFSGTDSFELEDPYCGEAYTFNGWYTENGTKVTRITAGTREDITLYARWTERTFKVTYNVYQTPVGEITDEKVLSYKPSKGLTGLPNPEIYNYVFLGWYNNEGEEVKEIPVGTTGDITLKPYLTSKRNMARAVKSLEDPIIIEDSDNGVIYFTYELGTIENVPLSDAIWTIQSVAGLAQQKSETITISISEQKAQEIADTISKSTVDSATWTLSKDWNDVTSVSEEWAAQQGLTVAEANELTKTESGTYSFTSEDGGCSTTTKTDGTTTVEYNSQNYKHGNSAEFNAKIHANYTTEVGGNVGLAKAHAKFEVGGEIGGGYEQHKETDEHTGTDTTKIKSTVESGTSSWNNSSTSSQTKAASQSESVSKALSEIISNTKGYGKSYSSGGENSESKEFSTADSKSVSTTSSLTYSSSETKTTTTTYSTDGKSDGCYRLVVAGTIHVFGVVGYDVATQSYFTYTFNVMDDKTHEFLDYSPDLNFDDYQNGVLPFEIPYFVHEYVKSKTVLTESLAYITDSTTGTAKVTNFGENIGTKEAPNWVYPALDVVVPSYIASGGNAYKVTEISATAFAGKPIRSIILSDYITAIPDNAFKNCSALEQISGRFTEIGDNAFSGCTALEGFTISSQTTHIGVDAFKDVETLEMNALYAEYISANVAETTQNVIQSAIESGAKNISIDISGIAADTVLTLDIPAMNSFELIGNKKVTYKNLKITSYAGSTKLRNLTVTDCTSVPLEIKAGDLILDTVNITSPSFVLLLAEDGASISLLRDSILTSQSGNAVVAKNPQVESLKDENVWGSLRISGNFYYCGSEPDSGYMVISNGKLIPLTENEFKSYIQGCFKITFDPNGGVVDVTEMTAFVGQSLGTLPIPTRTGHVFEGWFDSKGVQATEASAFTSVQDITLTAKWSAIAYKATWSAGTGCSIAVNRSSSPYAGAATGALSSGDVVYYGDVLKVTYTKADYYTIKTHGETAITVTADVTPDQIYATAELNPVSGWVKASALPAGAEVVNRKWTYTLTTTKESRETSLAGYSPVGSYWVSSGTSSFNYASFPSGFDSGNWYYQNWNRSAYTAYENTTSKREVENVWAGWIYWHWMYDTNYANGTTTRAIWNQYGYGPTEGYLYKFFGAFDSTTDYPSGGTGYSNNSGMTNYIVNDRTSWDDCQGAKRWFRFNYYTCYYTDYYKMFQYKKVESKESATNPTGQSGVSDVVEWVQYREK
ncbi:MAG: InlB B-repeat-containing protein [Oscillospiraceae bacterium]|nr:InlB B-repeat-containing protein [Oscillospiraceae bacterium]